MRKLTSFFVLLSFLFSCIIPPSGFTQTLVGAGLLPEPGTMLPPSLAYVPAHLRAVTIDPKDPFHFEFLVRKSEMAMTNEEKQTSYRELIKYFLAAMTVPDDQQWVNLSPYEGDRIISNTFGQTEMGRDLLAEDYLLKQLTASMIHPDTDLGRKFWNEIYRRAHDQFGTTDVPVDTFNKVWIIPDEAVVFEKGNSAFLLTQHLKVYTERDYLAMKTNASSENGPVEQMKPVQNEALAAMSQGVMKDVIVPAIEKEVNEGKTFAGLRQIAAAMVLATWYKKALKESILSKMYADQGKLKGVDQDPANNDKIYQQYVAAFKKGVFSLIKEDTDQYSQELIPRKYFSGGLQRDPNAAQTVDRAESLSTEARAVMADMAANVTQNFDTAAVALKTSNDPASVTNVSNRNVLGERPLRVAAALDAIVRSRSLNGLDVIAKLMIPSYLGYTIVQIYSSVSATSGFRFFYQPEKRRLEASSEWRMFTKNFELNFSMDDLIDAVAAVKQQEEADIRQEVENAKNLELEAVLQAQREQALTQQLEAEAAKQAAALGIKLQVIERHQGRGQFTSQEISQILAVLNKDGDRVLKMILAEPTFRFAAANIFGTFFSTQTGWQVLQAFGIYARTPVFSDLSFGDVGLIVTAVTESYADQINRLKKARDLDLNEVGDNGFAVIKAKLLQGPKEFMDYLNSLGLTLGGWQRVKRADTTLLSASTADENPELWESSYSKLLVVPEDGFVASQLPGNRKKAREALLARQIMILGGPYVDYDLLVAAPSRDASQMDTMTTNVLERPALVNFVLTPGNPQRPLQPGRYWISSRLNRSNMKTYIDVEITGRTATISVGGSLRRTIDPENMRTRSYVVTVSSNSGEVIPVARLIFENGLLVIEMLSSATQPVIVQRDAAANPEADRLLVSNANGGIDLAQSNLNLRIKRDGSGVPLPVSAQNMEDLQIDGLLPEILSITPAAAIPALQEALR